MTLSTRRQPFGALIETDRIVPTEKSPLLARNKAFESVTGAVTAVTVVASFGANFSPFTTSGKKLNPARNTNFKVAIFNAAVRKEAIVVVESANECCFAKLFE